MAFNANDNKTIRGQLTEEQKQRLAALETVAQPTDWSRGELAALRACANSDADRARVAALTARWAK